MSGGRVSGVISSARQMSSPNDRAWALRTDPPLSTVDQPAEGPAAVVIARARFSSPSLRAKTPDAAEPAAIGR